MSRKKEEGLPKLQTRLSPKEDLLSVLLTHMSGEVGKRKSGLKSPEERASRQRTKPGPPTVLLKGEGRW